MSDIETMVWATDVGDEEGMFPSSTAKYVAAALARRSWASGATHWSQPDIARKTGLSARTIWTALRDLEDAGLLRRVPRGGDGKRLADRLYLTVRAVTLTLDPLDLADEGLVDPRRFEKKTKLAKSARPDNSQDLRGDIAKSAREETPSTQGKGAKAPSPMPTKRRNTAPDDWEPKDAHREKVAAFGWPSGMLEEQAERFKEWEFREPKTDFDRAFHRWLRTENDRLKGRGHGSAGPNGGGSPLGRGPQSREDRIGAMHRGALAAADRFQRDG